MAMASGSVREVVVVSAGALRVYRYRSSGREGSY